MKHLLQWSCRWVETKADNCSCPLPPTQRHQKSLKGSIFPLNVWNVPLILCFQTSFPCWKKKKKFLPSALFQPPHQSALSERLHGEYNGAFTRWNSRNTCFPRSPVRISPKVLAVKRPFKYELQALWEEKSIFFTDYYFHVSASVVEIELGEIPDFETIPLKSAASLVHVSAAVLISSINVSYCHLL